MIQGPARYWRWAGSLGLRYGLTSMAALWLLGGLPTIVDLPALFLPVAAPLGFSPAVIAPLLPLGALAAGSVVNLLWTRWRCNRGKPPWELVPLAGIVPCRRDELPAAAALAVVAGVTEELFFRLLLPVLVALVSGSALAGFVLGTLLFAAMHRYQGWRGMAATAVTGAMLSVLYLSSGELWIAMAVHAVIDLNALVVRPLAGGQLWRNRQE